MSGVSTQAPAAAGHVVPCRDCRASCSISSSHCVDPFLGSLGPLCPVLGVSGPQCPTGSSGRLQKEEGGAMKLLVTPGPVPQEKMPPGLGMPLGRDIDRGHTQGSGFLHPRSRAGGQNPGLQPSAHCPALLSLPCCPAHILILPCQPSANLASAAQVSGTWPQAGSRWPPPFSCGLGPPRLPPRSSCTTKAPCHAQDPA